MNDLQRVASDEVLKAEQSGKNGADKYEWAFKGIRDRFPQLKESFINTAIEVAVLALQAAQDR